MKSLDRNIWWSSISLQTKIQLLCAYSQFFIMELTRGVWLWPPVDVLMHLTNGVFVCRIVHIPYTAHITNEEVRHRTSQLSVTSVITKRRLRLFGHLARADPSQDHSRILRAAINQSSSGLATPGRSTKADMAPYNWAELDLQPHILGLNTAWMRAQDRSKWRQLVETSMLTNRRYLMMMICAWRNFAPRPGFVPGPVQLIRPGHVLSLA